MLQRASARTRSTTKAVPSCTPAITASGDFFGYDVALLKGRIGTWFCAEHRPDDEAGLEFAGALA